MKKKENTFLLLSLEEEKAKKLANVIGSETCRKILDYLADKSATETQVSKELGMPLSTVHYNIQQLLKAGLVKADEFHYSEKGREVDHYSIANKYIIIAPKTSEGLASKLKRILPVFAIVAATGVAIQYLGRLFGGNAGYGTLQKIAESAAEDALRSAASAAEIAGNASFAVQDAVAPAEPNIALWFALGAVFALAVYLAHDIIKEKTR